MGELHIFELRNEALHRHATTATLHPAGQVIDRERLLPDLLDARIISMHHNGFSLAGFERIDGVDYAQSWIVSAIAKIARTGLTPK